MASTFPNGFHLLETCQSWDVAFKINLRLLLIRDIAYKPITVRPCMQNVKTIEVTIRANSTLKRFI